MQKELTINLSDDTYRGLIGLVGEKNASQFVEAVLRPYILLAEKKQTFKIHSPHLADSSQMDLLKVELVEE
ncbi:hypothetical protein BH20ACI4_BH20ACI4_25770 [soil metagenome]